MHVGNDRLVELANLLLACREAFRETSVRFQWIPEQGSPAAQAALEIPAFEDEITGPRGETGHELIAAIVQAYLFTASEHLGGLAILYGSDETRFSQPMLIRAIIESCAHAVWVLGDDPDEPSENRLARAYLEELVSAEEAKKNAGRIRSKVDPSFMQADNRYKLIKRQIVARFPQTTGAELGNRVVNGQVWLRLEETVVWMYGLTEKHGGNISERTASGIYGLLSNMTHPTLYTVRRRHYRVDASVTNVRVAGQYRPETSVENEARVALAAFYNALTYSSSYFGWSTDVLDGLTAKIEGTIPAFVS